LKDIDGRYNFEQFHLKIKFQCTPEEYNKITKYKDGLVYLFSDIAKIEDGEYIQVSVRGREFMFNRKEVSRIFLIDVDLTYLMALDSMGTILNHEPEAKRESYDCGQMKIATDLVILSQMVESNVGQKVLIVGSASDGYGGGRSYELLDTMFENSEFHLYDPNEINNEFVTDNKNKYVRHARPFVYESSEVKKYDLIQDDAYVTYDGNRDRIDKEGLLLNHKNFSCKILPKDKYYYGLRGYVMQQVGKTAVREKRLYSKPPGRIKDPDLRFGHCPFCLELRKYVLRGKYKQKFFDVWAKMHPPSLFCQENIINKVVGGVRSTSIGDMFIECAVPESFCFEFDQVPGCRVVNVLDKSVMYQFTNLSKVPPEMRGVYQFCVYEKESRSFLSSVDLKSVAPQRDAGDIVLQDIEFVLCKDTDKCVRFDCFHDPSITPKVNENILRQAYNFYERVIIEVGGVNYISVPRITLF